MKIHIPYIDLNKYFPAIVALYDVKVAEYNTKVTLARDAGDKTMQYLKSAHRELYFDFIRAIKGDLARNIIIFKDSPSLMERDAKQEITLASNRKRASERTKKSEATIYRLIQRLIDAGIIIRKINHGTQRDYELVFSPEMVLISDYKNDFYSPVDFFSKNAMDPAVQGTLRSICTPCSSNMNIIKNEIITMNNDEHEVESAPQILNTEHTRTFYKNTGDPTGPAAPSTPVKSPKINTSEVIGKTTNVFGVVIQHKIEAKINTSKKELSYADRMEMAREKDRQRTRAYAVRLVELVISVLFSTRNIYPSEREIAYKNAEFYFEKIKNINDCDKAFELYSERVRLVQNYLDRNKFFDFSNIWPAHYMDPRNDSSGFIMTGSWLKKHKNYQELQFKTRKLKTEEAIITYALNRMMRWKNPSSFQYWRSYVINKAPDRVEDYEQRALAIINEKYTT